MRVLTAKLMPLMGAAALAFFAVTLRQRTWPLLEMIRRSQQAGADIVWGV